MANNKKLKTLREAYPNGFRPNKANIAAMKAKQLNYPAFIITDFVLEAGKSQAKHKDWQAEFAKRLKGEPSMVFAPEMLRRICERTGRDFETLQKAREKMIKREIRKKYKEIGL